MVRANFDLELKHGKPEKLWMVNTSSFQWKGTEQLLTFASLVYKRLVEIEERVGHAGIMFRGSVGCLAFVRLDISLVWVEKERRYRFCLNEVQPGMFKFGQDSCAAATQFVDATYYCSISFNSTGRNCSFDRSRWDL